MSKTYILFTIEVQVEVSTLGSDCNIEGILCGPSDSVEVRELDALIAQQADLGAYNVQKWVVSDYPNEHLHKTA